MPHGFDILRIQPGLVEIREEAESYRMDADSLQKAIQHARANRSHYANEAVYQHRLEVYERALKIVQTDKSIADIERERLEQIIQQGVTDEFARAELLIAVRKYVPRTFELREALHEAVELIKLWHNMDQAGRLTRAEQESMWKTYQEQAPEMQRINEALGRKS